MFVFFNFLLFWLRAWSSLIFLTSTSTSCCCFDSKMIFWRHLFKKCIFFQRKNKTWDDDFWSFFDHWRSGEFLQLIRQFWVVLIFDFHGTCWQSLKTSFFLAFLFFFVNYHNGNCFFVCKLLLHHLILICLVFGQCVDNFCIAI